jgi:hypothetical protein
MPLTEEEQFIKERRQILLGKQRELDNANSKINTPIITPIIPDNTPSALQSVFSTNMDGYNPFVTKRPIITNAFNITLPKKHSLETLANRKGSLYKGGKKSKKRRFSKSKSKSRRRDRRSH